MPDKNIKVIYKRLKRVWGYCYPDHIELDERLQGKKHLEILTHEALHFLFPDASEKEITNKAIILTNTLWSESYRRTDNLNTVPLQDGSI